MTRKEALARAQDLRAAGAWQQSADLLAPFARAAPGDAHVNYYYAMALLESGEAESARKIYRGMVRREQHTAEALYMLARCEMELSHVEAAQRAFARSHMLKPTAMTLRSVANGAWMSGDRDLFARYLNAAPPELGVFAYGIWVEAEQLDQAEMAWTGLSGAAKESAGALVLRSQHMRQLGDGEGVRRTASAAFRQAPSEAAVIDALTVGHLMCGDGVAALQTIAPLRQSAPDNQHWIAHELTALRLLGDPGYGELIDFDAHVRAFQLPVPEGYGDLESFNAAFLRELDAKQAFAAHPIDQSLRLGSQTAQDLLAMETPAVKAYISALAAPIAEYAAGLGNATDHPLTRRNTGGFRIKGCWSVRLQAGGHHVNHVHPDGWISSAYYAAVPPCGADTESRAGWIKFGEPPFRTAPPLAPEKWIQPAPGTLVLFPSYLWHGTEPILDGPVRVTAPFDVVPL